MGAALPAVSGGDGRCTVTSCCYLYAEVLSPVTERVIEVEVSYYVHESPHRYRYRYSSESQATITSVKQRESELLPLLDADTITGLEREALAHWQEDMQAFNGSDHHE